MRVRREVIVEFERLRCRRAGRLVGHARVQQERRVLELAVGQAGRVRVMPVEPLEFHGRQLKRKSNR